MSLLIHTDCTGKLLPIILFWKCILMNKSDYINYALRSSGLLRFSGYDLFQQHKIMVQKSGILYNLFATLVFLKIFTKLFV